MELDQYPLLTKRHKLRIELKWQKHKPLEEVKEVEWISLILPEYQLLFRFHSTLNTLVIHTLFIKAL
jgi:hypothetical protein